MVVADQRFLILLQHAALNAPDADTAHIVVVVDGGDQQLQLAVFVTFRGGDIVENRVKKGREVGARLVRGATAGAGSAGAVEHRAVQLLIAGVEIHQQLQYLVLYFAQACVGLVDLIDDHNHAVVQLQRALQHKAGLRHGPLRRVHQQDNAVYHLEDTLHLAAEIRVTGGIHNVDLDVLVVYGSVLCQNGDATLALDRAGVHHAGHGFLVFTVNAALL